MDQAISCPDADVLDELMQGKLDDPKLSQLASHLEACPSCQEIAKTLSSHDTLTDSLRGDTASADDIARGIPRPLVEKLKAMGPQRGIGESDTAGFSGAPPEEPIDLSFLATAQGRDEMGRLGAFRILKILGKGGMGMVFLADDPELERNVALKVMLPKIAANPSAKQRFLREARAAAKLHSDHIVTIHHVGEDRGIPYQAMQLLDGMPLDQLLNKGKPIPLAETMRIGREIAQGLAVAHEKGMIHRDIKPSNLWLEPKDESAAPSFLGRVKILDFGLAKKIDEDMHLTHSGAIVGTPTFMAPEQARGEKVDARADLFSLGCVLYRLCVGDIPFKGETTMGVLLALAMNDPPTPVTIDSRIPQALSELIMKLLEKDAAKRPASARDVVARLQEIEKNLAGNMPGDATNVERSLAFPPMAEVMSKPGLLTALEQAKAEPKASMPPHKRPPIGFGAVVLLGLLFLGGGGIFALLQMGVIRFSNDQGDYVIATDDPDFAFSVSKGSVVLEDRKTKRKYNLKVVGGNKVVGEHELDVTDVDADLAFKTKTFTIKRGQEVALKAWFERKQVADGESPAADPERRAVERALEFGAVVKIQGKVHEDIRTLSDLPKSPFKLTTLTFISNAKITDADLATFKDCTGLIHLGFIDCPKITDAGLAHFRNCKGLTQLDVTSTAITDAGLAHFKDCKLTDLRAGKCGVTGIGLSYFKDCPLTVLLCANLPVTDEVIRNFSRLENISYLGLDGTRVTDDGLAHFRNCKNVYALGLSRTAVTNKGLAYFAGCKKLGILDLLATPITDAGLAAVKDCDELYLLVLNDTKVTDAGLAHLKNCKGLTTLGLDGTKVTGAGLAHLQACKLQAIDLNNTAVNDAGLEHLKGQSALTHVKVWKTKVTAEEVRALSLALPKCKIEWDGGVIEPTVAPDRRAIGKEKGA